ncbi:hypothetical protein FRC03_004449 [Tulasnella sp. 419]|nr:hypothetical protein FRC03_004449 [Tulasnella sp. 419]
MIFPGTEYTKEPGLDLFGVLGGLLGTQTGRDVEIVNTFELAVDELPADGSGSRNVNHAFFSARRDQYKQVFPSLDFIGWYTVSQTLDHSHVAIHEQFVAYHPTPLLLVLSPASTPEQKEAQILPFKAYEPVVEIKERKQRTVYVEAAWNVETGEAERIAVDWTAKGGEGGSSLASHLQTQRAAIKMLHDRIVVLVEYVTALIAGQAKPDHDILRSLSALVASIPASQNKYFREEFETEEADVLLTSYLSSLTKTQSTLSDIVDKYLTTIDTSGPGGRMKRRQETFGPGMRGMRGMSGFDDGTGWMRG